MAKIVENKKGFKVIEVSLSDIIRQGGLGVCDYCNKRVSGKGYYIAVLNAIYCEKCYGRWITDARYCTEDMDIERRNFDYMKEILNLD